MVPKNIKLRNDQILIIREAEKKDAPQVLEYVNKIAGETDYLTFGPGEFNLSIEQEEEFIEDHLVSDNKLFIIAEVDEILAGALTFAGGNRKRIQHTGEFGCSVLEKYWGLGIATKLVEALVKWAELSGVIKKINLKVRADNMRAINLYKRLGFCQEGFITREHHTSGQFYDSLFMGLQID